MLTWKLRTKIFALGVLIISFFINATAIDKHQRIKFAKGENSATVSGSIVRGKTDSYLIGGREGQKLSVKISSDEKNAVFQIRDVASDKYLNGAGAGDDAMEWSDSLPATGDYEIVISDTHGNADYKLSVSVK